MRALELAGRDCDWVFGVPAKTVPEDVLATAEDFVDPVWTALMAGAIS